MNYSDMEVMVKDIVSKSDWDLMPNYPEAKEFFPSSIFIKKDNIEVELHPDNGNISATFSDVSTEKSISIVIGKKLDINTLNLYIHMLM